MWEDDDDTPSFLSTLSLPNRRYDDDKQEAEGKMRLSQGGSVTLQLQNGEWVSVGINGTRSTESGNQLRSCLDWADLRIGFPLGEGGQGRVSVVEHTPTNALFAMKTVSFGKSVPFCVLQQELSHLLQGPNHHNVVQSVDAFFGEGKLHILMELMDIGTLNRLSTQFGPMSETVVSSIAFQVVEGLQCLHLHNIVHCDLKPSNLLINSRGQVKISDFGISMALRSAAPMIIGSHCYMSPEQLRAEGCSTPADVWSLGLLVAHAAVGVYPLMPEDDTESAERRRSSSFRDSSFSPSPWTQRMSGGGSAANCSPAAGIVNANTSNCWRNNDNASVCSSVPSYHGNPFEKPLPPFEIALLAQDHNLRVDFESLRSRVARFYPQWDSHPISTILQQFVWTCMSYDPSLRPSCSQLTQHPFTKQNADGNSATNVLRQWLQDWQISPLILF